MTGAVPVPDARTATSAGTSAADPLAVRFLRTFWGPALLAAGLLWTAFAPLDLGAGPVVLAWAVLLASGRLRGGARWGRQLFVAHLPFYLASIWWIAPLNAPCWIFVSFWCAAFEGLFGRLFRPLLAAGRGGAGLVLLAATAHVGADWVRTVLATGFPWHLPGYAAWELEPLLALSAWGGVHGATFVLLLTAFGLGESFARRAAAADATSAPTPPARPLLPAALGWAVALAALLTAAPPEAIPADAGDAAPLPLRAAVLQANIPQRLKEDRVASGEALPTVEGWWEIHERLAADVRARGGADLFVWPETMVPELFQRPFPAKGPPMATSPSRMSPAAPLRVAAAAGGAATLAGVPTFEWGDARTFREVRRRWNTAVLLAPDGTVLAWQDKRHRTPGGEYIPLLDVLPFRASFEAWMQETAGFQADLLAGDGVRLLPLPVRTALGPPTGGRPAAAGVLVCYESLFPSLAVDLTAAGADVLVNVSNYGWFAETPLLDQTLAHAAFRAAENARPFVLASNNGISAWFDARGRLRERTEADREAAPVFTVRLAEPGRTLFSRTGETPVAGLGGGAVLLAFLLGRRRKVSPKSGETS